MTGVLVGVPWHRAGALYAPQKGGKEYGLGEWEELKMSTKPGLLILVVLVLMPVALSAHPGHAEFSGTSLDALFDGALHPVLAPAHLFGLLAVGALAAIGRRFRSVWAWAGAVVFLSVHVYLHLADLQQQPLVLVYGIGLLLMSVTLCVTGYLSAAAVLRRLLGTES